MRHSSILVSLPALGAVAAAAILLSTACSGAGSKAIPPVGLTSEAQGGDILSLSGEPLASPGVVAPLGTSSSLNNPWLAHLTSSIPLNIAVLYVSGATCHCVLVYSQRGTDQAPIGIINGIRNPRGLFVDKEGELYVANSNAHVVQIFEEGDLRKPVETLTGTTNPSDVTRDGDSSDSTIYVVNQSRSNNISVYAHGSTTPTSYLYANANIYIDSVALDANHNLYAGYGDVNGGEIDEFKNGSTQPIKIQMPPLRYSGGIQIDTTNDLLLADPVAPATDVLAIGQKTPEFQFNQEGGPYYVALDKRERHVYVSDALDLKVREYTYPGGVLLDTISKGFEDGNYPIGVAVAHPGPL